MTRDEKIAAFTEAFDNNLACKLGQDGVLEVLDVGYGFIAWSLPNEEIEHAIEAIAGNKGYQPIVANEDFDPTEPESEINPLTRTITKQEFVQRNYEEYTDNECTAFDKSEAIKALTTTFKDVKLDFKRR